MPLTAPVWVAHRSSRQTASLKHPFAKHLFFIAVLLSTIIICLQGLKVKGFSVFPDSFPHTIPGEFLRTRQGFCNHPQTSIRSRRRSRNCLAGDHNDCRIPHHKVARSYNPTSLNLGVFLVVQPFFLLSFSRFRLPYTIIIYHVVWKGKALDRFFMILFFRQVLERQVCAWNFSGNSI